MNECYRQKNLKKVLRSEEIEVEEEERVVEKSRVMTRANCDEECGVVTRNASRDKVKECGVKEKSGVL